MGREKENEPLMAFYYIALVKNYFYRVNLCVGEVFLRIFYRACLEKNTPGKPLHVFKEFDNAFQSSQRPE